MATLWQNRTDEQLEKVKQIKSNTICVGDTIDMLFEVQDKVLLINLNHN